MSTAILCMWSRFSLQVLAFGASPAGSIAERAFHEPKHADPERTHDHELALALQLSLDIFDMEEAEQAARAAAATPRDRGGVGRGGARSRAGRGSPAEARHLLNFQFAPRETPPEALHDSARRRDGAGRQKREGANERGGHASLAAAAEGAYGRGQYVHAHAHAVLDARALSAAELERLCACPERVAPWEAVRQVRLLAHEAAGCPICLADSAVCAQVTQCGHVFCLPCITRHLEYSEQGDSVGSGTGGGSGGGRGGGGRAAAASGASRCPMCAEPLGASFLRSVRVDIVQIVSQQTGRAQARGTSEQSSSAPPSPALLPTDTSASTAAAAVASSDGAGAAAAELFTSLTSLPVASASGSPAPLPVSAAIPISIPISAPISVESSPPPSGASPLDKGSAVSNGSRTDLRGSRSRAKRAGAAASTGLGHVRFVKLWRASHWDVPSRQQDLEALSEGACHGMHANVDEGQGQGQQQPARARAAVRAAPAAGQPRTQPLRPRAALSWAHSDAIFARFSTVSDLRPLARAEAVALAEAEAAAAADGDSGTEVYCALAREMLRHRYAKWAGKEGAELWAAACDAVGAVTAAARAKGQAEAEAAAAAARLAPVKWPTLVPSAAGGGERHTSQLAAALEAPEEADGALPNGEPGAPGATLADSLASSPALGPSAGTASPHFTPLRLPAPSTRVSALAAALESSANGAPVSGTAANGKPASASASAGEWRCGLQAADGQRLFLAPLDARLLASQFGGWAALPEELTLQVARIEAVAQSEETRRRLRTAAHLPLRAMVGVCELDEAWLLKAVNTRTRALFSAELARRAALRARERAERAARERAAVAAAAARGGGGGGGLLGEHAGWLGGFAGWAAEAPVELACSTEWSTAWDLTSRRAGPSLADVVSRGFAATGPPLPTAAASSPPAAWSAVAGAGASARQARAGGVAPGAEGFSAAAGAAAPRTAAVVLGAWAAGGIQ
ncbi:hypothetical protein T492DRAFT_908549 [Pavlovales sp. CCMP2436]|nr:hypothetical protein T492DRAFT_908549 [Pavlovales sp. CCMP2436]